MNDAFVAFLALEPADIEEALSSLHPTQHEMLRNLLETAPDEMTRVREACRLASAVMSILKPGHEARHGGGVSIEAPRLTSQRAAEEEDFPGNVRVQFEFVRATMEHALEHPTQPKTVPDQQPK